MNKFTKNIYLMFFLTAFNISSARSQDNYGDYLNHRYSEYLDSNGKSIVDLVDRSEKVIFFPRENTPYCKSNRIFGYLNWPTWRNGNYFSNLGMCTNRILLYRKNFHERRDQINNTMNHEAFHAAQLCQSLSSGDWIPFGLQNGRFSKHIHDSVYKYYKNVNSTRKIVEMEAMYAADKPYLVKQYLKKYCY